MPVCSTAIYASMLTKAWRVYKIFETSPKAKKVVIKDQRLFLYIFLIVLFDVVVVLLWQLFDRIELKPRYIYELKIIQPLQVILTSSASAAAAAAAARSIKLHPNSTYFDTTTSTTTTRPLVYSSSSSSSGLKEASTNESMKLAAAKNSLLINYFNDLEAQHSSSSSLSSLSSPIINDDINYDESSSSSSSGLQNITYTNEIKLLYECHSNFNEVWITILTMYKIILLMYGIYVAWLIRNINVPSMNDSKYLLLSTYSCIICGLGSMTLIQVCGKFFQRIN